MARRERVVVGRKLRIDTTVVETNVHYPTDSSLLADGLRVLTRTMSRIEQAAGGAGEKLRDRMRSVGRMVMRIGRGVRSEQGVEQRRRLYGKLLAIGGRVVAQARRFESIEVARPDGDPLAAPCFQGSAATIGDCVAGRGLFGCGPAVLLAATRAGSKPPIELALFQLRESRCPR